MTTRIGRFIVFAAIMLIIVSILSIFGYFSTSNAYAGWPAPKLDTSDPETDYAIYEGVRFPHTGDAENVTPIGTKEKPFSTGLVTNAATYDFVNRDSGVILILTIIGGQLPESATHVSWTVIANIRDIHDIGNFIAYDNDCDGIFEDINHITDAKIMYIPICQAEAAGINIEAEQKKREKGPGQPKFQ